MPEKEQERNRRWRRAEEAELLKSFGERRKAFDALQTQRLKEEKQDRAAQLEATSRAGEPLWQLQTNRGYEVGPEKALEYRAEKPEIKRFGTHHLEEAALIRERYPSLSKWMGLGQRAAAAEKIPGGKKLHKTLEMLPDRLKNAVKHLKKQFKEEQEGYMPFGFDKSQAEFGLKSLIMGVDKTASKGIKEWRMKIGWEALTDALTRPVKRLPHEIGQLKDAAIRGYKGYDSDIYAKELDIFGKKGQIRGLADEAKYDVETKLDQDQRSPYHDPTRLNELRELQSEQHNRELKDFIKRGLVKPDTHKESTERLDNEREFARKMKDLGLAR